MPGENFEHVWGHRSWGRGAVMPENQFVSTFVPIGLGEYTRSSFNLENFHSPRLLALSRRLLRFSYRSDYQANDGDHKANKDK